VETATGDMRTAPGLYTWAGALVVLLLVVIAPVVANTRSVKVSWVFGSGKSRSNSVISKTLRSWRLAQVSAKRPLTASNKRRTPQKTPSVEQSIRVVSERSTF
jgi:hypothetical protein